MLHLEAEWPSKIYVNCRNNFVKTRPVASFYGLGGSKYIFTGERFLFLSYV